MKQAAGSSCYWIRPLWGREQTVRCYDTKLKSGQLYALRQGLGWGRKQPGRKNIWHLDEVVVIIAGKKHWLWRAVDQDGYVLDAIVQSRRNTKAAKRLLTRLLQKQGVLPKRIITDKLRSYRAARKLVMPHVEHRSHKGLNSWAENSHVPLRKRERMMQRFRSAGALQRLFSSFLPSEILSCRHTQGALPLKSKFIACRQWPSGKS